METNYGKRRKARHVASRQFTSVNPKPTLKKARKSSGKIWRKQRMSVKSSNGQASCSLCHKMIKNRELYVYYPYSKHINCSECTGKKGKKFLEESKEFYVAPVDKSRVLESAGPGKAKKIAPPKEL